MKKLLIKIFLMMLLSMALVFGISRIALYVMQLDGSIDPKLMYYISLISGLCGLILFAVLLNFFVIKRLKRLSYGVTEITKGNYEVTVRDKGGDELETLIKSFNQMAAELKANELLSREYVKNVSHELKTPLSSIVGYSDLILNKNVTEQEKQNYIQIIKDESNRLLKLSSQMLQISGIDSHTLIQKDDIFNPSEQIRDCILLMQNEWQNKNIEFEVDMQEFEINGNAELTRRVWQNLISNAVRYCNENGKISVKLFKGEKLNFTVSNTGLGIKDEDKPHIFRQFFTADKSKNKQGTGLGLPITKKILDKLGGNLTFTSDENLTVFSVEL